MPVQLVLALRRSRCCSTTRKLRLRGFYRIAFIVPFVTPLVAIAQIWVVVFDQNYGAVNCVLNAVGIPDVGWLTTSEWAKPTLALLFLWKTTGFIVIILLSGLQSIDPARLRGAPRSTARPGCRQLWSITVPLLRRTLMFSVVLQTLAVFQMFAEPFVVTQGGPYSSTTTAGLYLYNHITRADLGTGAANSFLLVILVMALSLGVRPAAAGEGLTHDAPPLETLAADRAAPRIVRRLVPGPAHRCVGSSPPSSGRSCRRSSRPPTSSAYPLGFDPSTFTLDNFARMFQDVPIGTGS